MSRAGWGWILLTLARRGMSLVVIVREPLADRSSAPHAPSAVAVVEAAAAAVGRTIGHLLPAVLGLACLLAAVHALWHESLQSTDAWAMRRVDQLAKWGAGVPGVKLLADTHFKDGFESGSAFGAGGVSLVTLSPEAHSYFFGRQSPLPRDRVACLISVFAQRIESLERDQPGAARGTKRVVGLDFDVTPVEAPVAKAMLAAVGPDDAARPALPPPALSADSKPEEICAAPASAEQMRAALGALQRQAEVVAIVYPRSLESARLLRNNFIRQTCRCPLGGSRFADGGAEADACDAAPVKAAGGGIWYASPQVLHPPLELVTEYPTVRKRLLPAFSDYTPPPYFPTLGAAMGFVGRNGCAGLSEAEAAGSQCGAERRIEQDATVGHYCRSLWDRPRMTAARQLLLDDRLADRDSPDAVNLPAAFEYQNIDFGPAQTKVSMTYVYPPKEHRDDENPAGTPVLLKQGLETGLANLQQSEAFILAIDSGTTEDKFMVPVLPEETVGGWLHAAIAVSEPQPVEASAALEVRHASERQERVAHLLVDILLGLFLSACMTLLVAVPERRAPVLRQVLVATWPLFAGALAAGLGLLLAGKPFSAGHWYNPLLMCLGFVLHIYLEAPHLGPSVHGHAPAQPESAAPHADRHPGWTAFDGGLRALLQIGWCAVVAAGVFFVVVGPHWDEAQTTKVVLFGVALAMAGVVYWLAALRRYVWLPLPWRVPVAGAH